MRPKFRAWISEADTMANDLKGIDFENETVVLRKFYEDGFSVETEANEGKRLEILVETAKGVYKKHMVNLTSWNMYVVEDLEGAEVDQYKYEVNYMPESIIPFKVTKKD